MMNQKTVDPSPLTLALSPRGKRVKWKINCGGRGDNRKKILSLISDRVKYMPQNLPAGAYENFDQRRSNP